MAMTEDDTFNALRRCSIYDFRAHVITHGWDFVLSKEQTAKECAKFGWTWDEYCKEFNRLSKLGLIK